MPKYRVVVEAPGLQEVHEFEADNPEEAEEVGREIFFDICNFGISAVDEDDD
ncbi:hypothetical protein [Enterobacter cloacae complex sp. 2024EL-00243]|uniref:hypothetical protein n=1 Tax=Enterobacter cloacae complex TaxID=354276 RepID=UPI00313417EB|nr:hypothetical protein [Salmonella enterica]HBM7602025.1 hypothetical protein [Enterobacter asburiae]HBM7662587.1 hypothetical protein [Enterobacter asburiae]HBM7676834.1 hypothetical protein [Enterobacter asburiae]